MKHLATAIAGLALFAASASATYVDFTDASFETLLDGKTSETYVGPYFDILFEAEPSATSVMNWEKNDGVGISGPSYEDDEIEGDLEVLTLTFDWKGAPNKVQYFDLTDLFTKDATDYTYSEIGYYSIDGGTKVGFTADDPSSSNGDKRITINSYLTTLAFYAPGRIGDEHHEFSVAGVKVPEPGMLWLMGFGLVSVFGWVRPKRRKD